MIVNLINDERHFSLTLPTKVKGQFWISDTDKEHRTRQLISIEGVDGKWTAKSNKKVSIVNNDASDAKKVELNNTTFLVLKIESSNERVVLFTEPIEETRQLLKKYAVQEKTVFSIGRTEDNIVAYDNPFVSGHHADLIYDGNNWSIEDAESHNGTYVNGKKIRKTTLSPGDYIYIMGLKIVIGKYYFAINNPDKKLRIRTGNLKSYMGQSFYEQAEHIDALEKQYFMRSPRFYREIEHEEIKIDPPPAPQKLDTVPLALMLGPSITMGLTSVSTGILALTNAISNGGNIMQTLPTLVMSVSMLLGTVMWPILTKRYEKKAKVKSEQKRQTRYLEYLDQIGEKIKSASKQQEDILRHNLCSQEDCSERIVRRKSNLWERILGQDDFLKLRIGIGKLPFDADIKYQEKKFSLDDDTLQDAMLSLAEGPKELKDVPISVSLTDNIALGLFGSRDKTSNMLKGMILQMISLHSYDELKIMLITDEGSSEQWDFVKYIPHFWNDDKTARFYATNADEVKELSSYIEKNILTREEKNNGKYDEYNPYYVIIFTSSKLGKKCESVRGLLNYKSNVGFSLIYSNERFDAFPKETKTIIEICGDKSKIYDKDNKSGEQVCFTADTANEKQFESLSEKIANIELDNNSKNFVLPSMLTFLEMFNVGKVEHLNSLTRWKENNPTKSLQTPIGVDVDGDIFSLDLHEKYHGPHGLVAGMTGSGKSEFIITYILSLAVNYHPNEVSFILIDYKGGGLTGAFEDKERGIKLPHLSGTITNLDGSSIKRSLTSIQSELRRRQALFNKARKISNEGTMDIYKYQQLYREMIVTEPLPHLLIISDEFAELKMQQPEFMEQLISTARIGRSLGVHLILATQKPNGVVDDQIWSNSKFRVCLKVQDKSDSQDMIKCPDAAELSQTGRFYLQVGFNEFFALGQSAWCGAEYVPSDTLEKLEDTGVQVIDNLGRVIMNVKQVKATAAHEKRVKQVVAIVKYLSELASEEKVQVKSLWLDPIPEKIYIDELETKYRIESVRGTLNPIVGEYDDPFNQRQELLTIPLTKEGNCLVYGATGNGKTTFLTTLCYSLIKHLSANELNLYILDFGSETLKAFEDAPQVGGVITSADEEKTINFIKMIKKEMDIRKSLFASYGGDYQSYIKNADTTVPNIVIAINNFSAFAEQYEELLEDFCVITREGIKYGIYFVMTASSTNAVRYKIQQNFKMMLTMQLNDPTEYSLVVGRTDGLVPTKFKGRGLVALDKPYEFQTAYCTKDQNTLDYLRSYCKNLSCESKVTAKTIPILPPIVNLDFVAKSITNLGAIPIGVGKQSLEIISFNLQNKVVLPIFAQDISSCEAFVGELSNVLTKIGRTVVLGDENHTNLVSQTSEEIIQDIFRDMVLRNNTYKDSGADLSSLESFDEITYVIFGFKKLMDKLSSDGQDKLKTLLDKAEPYYKLHFVICESISKITAYNYDDWFKHYVSGSDGVWIGDGIAEQYTLKISKLTSELYDEVSNTYGYIVEKGRATLIKLLSNEKEEI